MFDIVIFIFLMRLFSALFISRMYGFRQEDSHWTMNSRSVSNIKSVGGSPIKHHWRNSGKEITLYWQLNHVASRVIGF